VAFANTTLLPFIDHLVQHQVRWRSAPLRILLYSMVYEIPFGLSCRLWSIP
jgi:hypothetical protein